MMEKLVQKHELWVKMAREICGDNYLADDLVSEMYLKLAELGNKEFNNHYVYLTIKHRYMDHLKEERHYAGLEHASNACAQENEPTQYENIALPDTLTWVEKQILLLRTEKSGRDIEEQYHINYQKVHRIEKRAKQKLEEWAKQYAVPATL